MKKGTVYLLPEDVLHIPALGFDGLVGYSPIAMAKNSIGVGLACEEYGAKFFANGAAPSGKKRMYSCTHCFSQMVVCGSCGEVFRRIHWNNHGCRSIVWRCASRLE